MSDRSLNRIGAICGFIGVAGNVVGVAMLGDIPSAYRPGTLTQWVHETINAPAAASASAIGFMLGLAALAGWAWAISARLETPLARAAGMFIGAGALLDAAGCPAPLVLAEYLGRACRAGGDCVAVGVALLGTTLVLDAFFNVLLGAGLVMLGFVMRAREGTPRWIAWLTFVAGVVTLPVSLQWFSPTAANLLLVAGPLWLAAVAVTSIYLWRDRL